MKTKFLILLIACASSSMFGQASSTGMSFLKLGIGARNVAMGETGAAYASDASASYYNPAALSFAAQTDITVMHKEWIADIATEYFGAAVPGETVSLGFSFNATNTGGIDVRTRPGEAEGTFNAHDMAITGSLGFSIADGIAVGVSGKFLYEKIYVDESSGYAFDFGGLYQVSPDLTLGLSVNNLGSMNEMRTEVIELPTLLRAGASYTGVLTDRFSYRVSGDYVNIFKQSDSHVHLGAELGFDNTLAIRAGYQTGYEAKSISGGLGVIYGKVRFDYAFVPFTSGFGSTHTFSLSFRI